MIAPFDPPYCRIPHVTRKPHGSMFYGTEVMITRNVGLLVTTDSCFCNADTIPYVTEYLTSL